MAAETLRWLPREGISRALGRVASIEPPRVIDRLNYRSDGAGYTPEGFTHIFLISDAGGVPRQLTDGDYNHNAPEWMPDSQSIVFSGVRKPDAEYIRFGQEIYSENIKTNQIKAIRKQNRIQVKRTNLNNRIRNKRSQ